MNKLIIITSELNREIISQEENILSTNKPFTRHNSIIKLLSTMKESNIVTLNSTIDEIETKIKNMECVDSNYLDFLKNAYKSYLENGCPSDNKSPYDDGLVAYCFPKNNKPYNNLPHYLQCGIYGNDFCTSIFGHTYETALRSAENGIIAADYCQENDTIIYCANILPGHHATDSTYSGYCFLNNAAICAKKLLETNQKIAILDLDFHHGDGTQKIFYENDNVLTISLHANPTNSYPFYSGYENEFGEKNGLGYNLNYPLEKNTNIEKYLSVLGDAMDKINKFCPDVLIIPFGADTYELDPQGSFKIELPDYTDIGELIKRKFKNKIIITQEGGYFLDLVDAIVYNFIRGMMYRK